jgi:ribosome-associated translation inhibitor RaiA
VPGRPNALRAQPLHGLRKAFTPKDKETTMQVAPEIKFKDVDRTEWVEAYVGGRVQSLERLADHITSCHVTVTQEQGSQQKGNVYSVMVQVRMPPNRDLAAKKEREILDMHAELPALINSAFGAIEKQVKKTKG